MLLTVPKPERAEAGKWGESKRRVQIMLTPMATDKIDTVADQMSITRSELLELLIRSDCLDVEVLKRVEVTHASGKPAYHPKSATPGERPIEESFPRPANPAGIKQRISDPHTPSPSFEEERQLIGDDNPTNPYTPPSSITPRGGK